MPRPHNPLGYALKMFNHQKAGARKRKIKWNLSFNEWYNWFLSQGIDRNIPQQKINGDAYCMCRIGDIGAYELDNIYLGNMRKNSSEAHTNNVIKYRSGENHQNSKKVITPIGIFASKAEATKAYKVTAPTMGEWLKKKPKEFYYACS
jgi:hypothetical protein